MPPYIYDPDLHRYRDTANGKLVSFNTVMGMSEASMSAGFAAVEEITERYLLQVIDLDDWEKLGLGAIKREAIRQYALGRGGLAQMTAKDWGIVGRYLRDEYEFFAAFKADILAGKLSEAQIRQRIAYYIEHAGYLFERGKTWFLPRLPAYPKDCNTACCFNCKCYWEIVQVEGGYDLYWRTTAAESCDDCIDRAGLYAPLQIRNGEIIS